MAFDKTAQTSFGAFSELFQYTYADVIIKLLDTVDDVEKWIDSVNQEDWNGGDSSYYLYKTADGVPRPLPSALGHRGHIGGRD